MMTVKLTILEISHHLSMLSKLKQGCTLYNSTRMDQIKCILGRVSKGSNVLLRSPTKYITPYYTNGTHKRKRNFRYGLPKHCNFYSERISPQNFIFSTVQRVYSRLHNIIYKFENIARKSQM